MRLLVAKRAVLAKKNHSHRGFSYGYSNFDASGTMRMSDNRYDLAVAELKEKLGTDASGEFLASDECFVDKGFAKLAADGYLYPYFAIITNWIHTSELSCGAFSTLCCIAAGLSKSNWVVNQKTIAKAIGVSREQVGNYVEELKTIGYLETKPGGQGVRGWQWEYKINSNPRVAKKDVKVTIKPGGDALITQAANSILKRYVRPDWEFCGRAKQLEWALQLVGTGLEGHYTAEGILRDQLPSFFEDQEKAKRQFWGIAEHEFRKNKGQQQ